MNKLPNNSPNHKKENSPNLIFHSQKETAMKQNPFFPCQLVEYDDYCSVICSDFHYFNDYFEGKGVGGYTLEKLAKKIAKDNAIKELKFDSEAGMFCAYSTNMQSLQKLCELLRTITDNEINHLPNNSQKPKISEQHATELLLSGFVMDLNPKAQQKFLENMPFSNFSITQEKYIQAIKNGTDEERITALKEINAEACLKVRNFHHYLSHPQMITILLELANQDISDKVKKYLILSLWHITMRHLPDLRCREFFYQNLTSKKADFRLWSLLGLQNLYQYNLEKVVPLLNDKSNKVKEKAQSNIEFGLKKDKNINVIFPSWMFDEEMIENIQKDLDKSNNPHL